MISSKNRHIITNTYVRGIFVLPMERLDACVPTAYVEERASVLVGFEDNGYLPIFSCSLVADEGEMMIGYGRRKATQKKHCYLSPEETLKYD